ncbi:T9SS type A sorting domain-containing protein [Dawidia soli]|uniref:T9SS type A sorting domain-containing protein n=1 Tax=Dawidia soli TaxID=2782352 RepID=A0AAP2GGG5_9BACT|nr:T9SS type A sorting domain-containing protein [Dawidia soli]MBT1686106.1 T9SS type A sorting domain-containing protein [Dawidia soli]
MKAPPRKNLTGILALLSLPLWAQQHDVVSVAGDSFVQATGSLTFTLGEVAIETVPAPHKSLTQGFHQPRLSVKNFRPGQENDQPFFAYPNPVGTRLYLQSRRQLPGARYTVLDLRGLPVREGPVTELTEISFDALPPATYVLQIKKQSALIQTFKITRQ